MEVIVVDLGIPRHVGIERPEALRPWSAISKGVGCYPVDGPLAAYKDVMDGVHRVGAELTVVDAITVAVAAEHAPLCAIGVPIESEGATGDAAVIGPLKPNADRE